MKKIFVVLLSLLCLNIFYINDIKANDLTPQQNIEFLSKRIKENPKDAKAYAFRGAFKGMIGDIEGSLKDANYSIKLDPYFSESYWTRASAYYILFQRADNNSDKEQLYAKNAINDYTKCLELGGPRKEAYYYRGFINRVLKKYDNAIGDFTIAISMGFNDAEIYYQRGLCYFAKRNSELARSDFENAVRLNPENEEYQKMLSLY